MNGGLTIFGAAAVAPMLTFYEPERCGGDFMVAFAGARFASSVHRSLAGTWPFGVIEVVWAGVAARRWATAKTVAATAQARVP
ncbi:MAG: hypothetical protein C0506_13100 [Anaerolinea sp.]|nr:hypothetical protein [Anaerolinea sp.]